MKHLFLSFFVLISTFCLSQNFGGNSPSIKWNQIDTDTVRVIFPTGMEQQAKRIVSIIHKMDSDSSVSSVGKKMGKINIVLQVHTTVSNGYVGLGPMRSEYFATPPADPNFLGTLDWLDVLTVHENRHVLQNYNTRYGVTRWAYILFGQYGWSVASHLAIPSWYWEGDAVVTETALTKSGRGRLPDFSLEQRALWLTDQRYTYVKASNGSLKDIVPNHYPLGYTMCSHVRNEFGNDTWAQVIKKASGYRRIWFPFSMNLNKITGLRTPELYRESYTAEAKKWKAIEEENVLTEGEFVNSLSKKKVVTDYRYPQVTEDDEVICLKSAYNKAPCFVAINESGKEKRLFSRGYASDDQLYYQKGILVTTELRMNARWSNKDFSELVVHDLKSKRKYKWTSKGKYFSPSLDSKGDLVAVAHYSQTGRSEIRFVQIRKDGLLNNHDRKDVRIILSDDHAQFMYPVFGETVNDLYYILKKDGQLSIHYKNLETGFEKLLLKPTRQAMAGLRYDEGKLYFSASFTGIDNIFSLDVKSQKLLQLTSVRVAAQHPVIDNDGNLVYSEMSIFDYPPTYKKLKSFWRSLRGKAERKVRGYDIVKLAVDSFLNKPYEIEEPCLQAIYQTVANKTEKGILLDNVTIQDFEVKKYRKLSHPINIHSWSALISTEKLGLKVYSDNILNSITIVADAGVNSQTKDFVHSLSVFYAGLYPIIGISVDRQSVTGTNSNYLLNSQRLSLQVPLRFINGAWSKSFSVITALAHQENTGSFSDFSAYYQLNFGIKKRAAKQNINTRLGLETFYSNSFLLPNQDVPTAIATQDDFKAYLYLPGLSLNHSLNFDLSLRFTSTFLRSFVDDFSYARGFVYNSKYNTSGNKTKIGVNYDLPLFYPDFGIRGVIYLMRIRAKLFYDYMLLDPVVFNSSSFQSTGVELYFDTRIFNNLPISFGMRWTITGLDSVIKNVPVEFVLGANLRGIHNVFSVSNNHIASRKF